MEYKPTQRIVPEEESAKTNVRPMNPTPQPAWKEEFLGKFCKDGDYVFFKPGVIPAEIMNYVRSLLKEDTAAIEHEKSMTDIAFAFEAGEKSGRTATLREVMEELPIKPSYEKYEQGSSSYERRVGADWMRGKVIEIIQNKLTSEL